MFIINLTYVRPLQELDAAMKAHVAFLHKYYKKNVFIVSGRKVPREGGIIVAHGVTRKALEAIVDEDPFKTEGLAKYEIIEFNPSQHGASFAAVLADAPDVGR